MASSLTPVGPQTLGTQAHQNLPYLPEVGGGLAAGPSRCRVRRAQPRSAVPGPPPVQVDDPGPDPGRPGRRHPGHRYISPSYQVGATIWIETPDGDRAGTPIQGDRLLRSRAWVDLLTTYIVLDPVVRERKLYLSSARGPDSALFRGFSWVSDSSPATMSSPSMRPASAGTSSTASIW